MLPILYTGDPARSMHASTPPSKCNLPLTQVFEVVADMYVGVKACIKVSTNRKFQENVSMTTCMGTVRKGIVQFMNFQDC